MPTSSYPLTDEMIARQVCSALRHEHANTTAALKHIERITGIPAATAGKWYGGRYAPRSRHLLTLAAHYPEVLRLVLEFMGVEALWQEAIHLHVVERMRAQLDSRLHGWHSASRYRERFVLIRAHIDACLALQLNQRQLWFLGQLQQGYDLPTDALAQTWQVHTRTARRDIRGLLQAELIRRSAPGGAGCYELRW